MRRYSHLLVVVLIGGLLATGIAHASAQTQDDELIVTAVCTINGDVLRIVNPFPNEYIYVSITLDTGLLLDEEEWIPSESSDDPIPDGSSTYSIEWYVESEDVVRDGGSGSLPLCGLTVTEAGGTAAVHGRVTVHRYDASWDELLAAIIVDDQFVAGEGGLNEFSIFADLPAGTEYTTAWTFFQDSDEPPLLDGPSGVVPLCEETTTPSPATTTIPEVETDIANGDGTTPTVPVLIAVGFLTLVAVALRARRIER